MAIDKFGLRPLERDGTEFNVGAVVRLLDKAQLPKKFSIDIPDEWVENQRWDTCAKEGVGVLLSYLNGRRVDALLPWVLARTNNGYAIEDYGIDVKSILLAAVKVGAPNYEDSPFHGSDERSDFADITKWDLKALLPKAIVNKAGSAVFIEPTNGMDYFDTIRSAMVTLKAPVAFGMLWNFSTDNPKILKPATEGYGHLMIIIGYDDERVEILDLNITLNSWGIEVGEHGRFFLSREVLNHDVAVYGAGTLIDETPEKIKWLLENGIYLNDGNWLLQIAKALIIALKRSLKSLVDESKTGTVPPYPLKVVKMAEAIKFHEGFFIGSRSRRNNNPGNFKYIGQYKSTGKDAQGFAIFPDYETGWNHLLKVLHNACVGKSFAYKNTMTLYEYFAKYAPDSDDNDPKRYAKVVALYIGVSPFTQLKDLI